MKAPFLKDTGALALTMADGTTMTAMTRNWTRLYPDSLYVQAIHKYYRMQSDIYQRRLEKFKSSVTESQEETFFDHSLGASQPFLIVLNSTQPLCHPSSRLLGGIRVVIARSPEEKLPFQSEPAFNHCLLGSGFHGAAEIGRLTAESQSNRQLGADLITVGGMLTLQFHEVHNFYVHTSRTHAKLYSRMGLTPNHPPYYCDSLNCLIHYNRQEIINFSKRESPVRSLLQTI